RTSPGPGPRRRGGCGSSAGHRRRGSRGGRAPPTRSRSREHRCRARRRRAHRPRRIPAPWRRGPTGPHRGSGRDLFASSPSNLRHRTEGRRARASEPSCAPASPPGGVSCGDHEVPRLRPSRDAGGCRAVRCNALSPWNVLRAVVWTPVTWPTRPDRPPSLPRREREDTMSLVRRIARPLLAAPFVVEGVCTALHPEREIDVYPQAFDAADSAIAKSSAPGFLDVRTIVRSTGAIAAGAGVLYATNRCPRAAAVTLLATTSVGWA